MAWEIVEAESMVNRGEPLASVARGTLSLNSAAADLIGPLAKRAHAQLLFDDASGNYGIRFLEEPAPSCIRVHSKSSKGRKCKGLTMTSKAIMCATFGDKALGSEYMRFPVRLDTAERDVVVLGA